jgi:hypothetical protein
VSFVSTRPEDNTLNCDEELDIVLLKLQDIIVAHVVEDYVYRGCRKPQCLGGKHSRDGEKHRRNRRRNPRHPPQLPDTDSPPDLLFACPYSESDPLRYSQRNPIEMNYRDCLSRRLKDISRVKQHL